MDYTTLKNRVFENYYFNSYLPGTLGAYESSIIFNYLLALESIQENSTTEMNISEKWVDDVPTWYTIQLPQMFFIPRFSGETDQEYIDRLFLLTEVGQNNNTIIAATFSVVEKAITGINKVTIVDQLEGVSAAYDSKVDLGPPPPEEQQADWDGTSVWSSKTNVPRTLFLIDIEILNRGSPLDITTWDYWINSQNYTKIEDMVNLYKPPGSTFELRLNIPTDYTAVEEIFSLTEIYRPMESVSLTRTVVRGYMKSVSVTRTVVI